MAFIYKKEYLNMRRMTLFLVFFYICFSYMGISLFNYSVIYAEDISCNNKEGNCYWDDRFFNHEEDGRISAIAFMNGSIYVGGIFKTIGGETVNNIARWDGKRWHALGKGVSYMVNALAFMGNDLYVGGHFNTAGEIKANNIARWDGEKWHALDMGVSFMVNTLAVMGNDLYVGGRFDTAGGIEANSIARWDGERWSGLGKGLRDGDRCGYVTSLIFRGNDLYVSGIFDKAGDLDIRGIAVWDGAKWSSLGDRYEEDLPDSESEKQADKDAIKHEYRWLRGSVSTIIFWRDDMYAGGLFHLRRYRDNRPVGVTIENIARWDGKDWHSMGHRLVNLENKQQLMDTVSSIVLLGSDLYAVGSFDNVGHKNISNIAVWDGNEWRAFNDGISNHVFIHIIKNINNELYAGGSFKNPEGVVMFGFARWDGENWQMLGDKTGMGLATTEKKASMVGLVYRDPAVYALASNKDIIYAGGVFNRAGGIKANYIAKWNGENWQPLGEGINNGQWGLVYAIAVKGDNVYVGGSFKTAGETEANNIARWDGEKWSALGMGIDGTVYAMAILGRYLYVGGRFTRAGDAEANNIARWDGEKWSALGKGIGHIYPFFEDYSYEEVSISGGDLIVETEYPPGAIRSSVYAMAVRGDILYVGGLFSNADEKEIFSIAKWDGKEWSALGDGITGIVYSLAVNNDTLYAGGTFTRSGDTELVNIAQWDGKRWTPLGAGMDHGVYALALFRDKLYAGGSFKTAGGTAVNRIALWDGENWYPLGSGIKDLNTFAGIPWGYGPGVAAIAIMGDKLYAGGEFITAGDKSSRYIACWHMHEEE